MRSSTSPPLSFIRTRNGRSGVYLITVSEHGIGLDPLALVEVQAQASATMALMTSPCEQMR